MLGHLSGTPVLAPRDGLLRGIVRDGSEVPAGIKLLEITTRKGPAPTSVDAIEVHWPDGKVENFTVPGVDRIVILTKGTGK